ncbi:MAG: isoprenyl transferase [Bdellovibrionales bacterium]
MSNTVPAHIGIIMDGNGRWAEARGVPRLAGHKAGIDAVRRTLEAAKELGVRCMTLYAFSTENWQRPAEEVENLMGLLRFYMKSELAKLHEEGVCIRVLGNKKELDADIQDLIRQAEALTQNNNAFTLCLAINYGGRQEIITAVQQLQSSGQPITDALLAATLYTHGLPDPDLIIRTSGEQRLSNFLLWQSAYAELYFTPVLWPDFGREDLEKAIAEYSGRQRRFGGLADGAHRPKIDKA